MGPLFSLLLVLTLAVPVILLLFVVAKLFLPLKTSLLMALLPTFAGAVGFGIAALAQAPFYPAKLQSEEMVALYLGISFSVGILAAIFTGVAIWWRSRRVSAT